MPGGRRRDRRQRSRAGRDRRPPPLRVGRRDERQRAASGRHRARGGARGGAVDRRREPLHHPLRSGAPTRSLHRGSRPRGLEHREARPSRRRPGGQPAGDRRRPHGRVPVAPPRHRVPRRGDARPQHRAAARGGRGGSRFAVRRAEPPAGQGPRSHRRARPRAASRRRDDAHEPGPGHQAGRRPDPHRHRHRRTAPRPRRGRRAARRRPIVAMARRCRRDRSRAAGAVDDRVAARPPANRAALGLWRSWPVAPPDSAAPPASCRWTSAQRAGLCSSFPPGCQSVVCRSRSRAASISGRSASRLA